MTEQTLSASSRNPEAGPGSERLLVQLNGLTYMALEVASLEGLMRLITLDLQELAGADGCLMSLWPVAGQHEGEVFSTGSLQNVAPRAELAAHFAPGRPLDFHPPHIQVVTDPASAPFDQLLSGAVPRPSMLVTLAFPQLMDYAGGIFLAFNQPRELSSLEIATLQKAVQITVLALQRSLLLESIRGSVGKLQPYTESYLAMQVLQTHPELPDQILDQIKDLLEADGMALVLNRPASGVAYVRQGTGLWADLPGENLRSDQMDGKAFQAAASVPIITDRQMVGMLWIRRDEPLSVTEVLLFKGVGSLIGSALRLYSMDQTLQRTIQISQQMFDLSQLMLNETPDLGSLLQHVTDTACRLVPASERAAIHWLDASKRSLWLAAESGSFLSGAASDGLRASEPASAISQVLAQALEKDETLNFGSLRANPDLLPEAFDTPINSVMAAPIRLGREALGTISLESRKTNAFTSVDEYLLRQLSLVAGLSAKNARLYHDERQQHQMAEALSTASSIINSSLELDVVLDRILEQALQVSGCSSGNIMLMEAGRARIVRQRGRGAPVGSQVNLDIPTLQYMAETGQPVVIVNTDLDPRWSKLPGTGWMHSYIGAPMKNDGNVVGFLSVESDAPNMLDAEAGRRLQAFASHAAIAIQNARLHADLQAKLDDLQAAQARLLQSEKLAAIGQLVAGVAHELNNPLTSVLLNAQLIQSRSACPEASIELQKIEHESRRAAGIVRNLLDFARQTPQKRRPVQINTLLKNTLDLIGFELRAHHVACELQLDANLPLTQADPQRLQQVFINLLHNARQAINSGSDHGQIFVTTQVLPGETEGSPGKIQICFQDDGPGIPTDVLPRIFDPFFTTKPAGQGTGLGLSICHGIVTEHEGRIWVESQAGQGARFWVELPVVLPSRTTASETPAPKKLVRSGRLLVIDDESNVLEVLQHALQKHGYQVDTSVEAKAGLDFIKAQPYDLVLCDLYMPGLGGLDFYEQVETEHPELAQHILLMSGDMLSAEARRMIDQKSISCLSKPFELDELLRRVDELIQS